MPLSELGKRYAERLYQNSQETIITAHQAKIVEVRSDHTARGTTMSGMYVSALSRALIEQIRQLAEARSDSLLKAYEREGLPFDDATLSDIKSEVMQFCQSKQHDAVNFVWQMISQTFGSQGVPANLEKAAVDGLSREVDGIMSRLSRNLLIKRDEVMLDEAKVRKAYAAGLGKKWDVFISHASEDKEAFVGPLAASLTASGLSVWYDETVLTVGDSLRRKIDEGLANSRYGIVVLSTSFFAKNWPQSELDGLFNKEVAGTGTKVILPVWHNITHAEVSEKSPMLAGRYAVNSEEGLDTVVRKLREAMGL